MGRMGDSPICARHAETHFRLTCPGCEEERHATARREERERFLELIDKTRRYVDYSLVDVENAIRALGEGEEK